MLKVYRVLVHQVSRTKHGGRIGLWMLDKGCRALNTHRSLMLSLLELNAE